MATATMEDLIASLGGSMHVSQEGYDLKALQDFLARTISRPALPLASPNAPFRPIPPSRSTSVTRKPSSGPTSYSYPESSGVPQPYPSPMMQSSFSSIAEDGQMLITAATPLQRPGGPLRRSSSYGFGCAANGPSSPATTYSSFDTDAFAPLYQEQVQSSDPWARMRGQPSSAFGAYPGENMAGPSTFAAQPSAFGNGVFRQAQGFGQPQQAFGGMQRGRQPTPPDEEDEEMDEDAIDAEMDEDEDEEESVERVMGLNVGGDVEVDQAGGDVMWGRGRRKY
ncbi:hypothetical protein IAU60_004226 [Kwoniella sp. DSM 27419]